MKRPVLKLKRPLTPAPAATPVAEPQLPSAGEREMVPLDAPVFFFLWVAGRRAPRHRWATEAAAREELARLRAAVPEGQVYLFRAVRADEEDLP
jgi:hypothetical protein